MGFIVCYVTHPNELVAKKVSNFLLDKRLIACYNLHPITSGYWWKGKIENDKEWVAIYKTRTSYWEQLQKTIESVHPYEVPCIVKFEVTANAAYEQWIQDETEIKV